MLKKALEANLFGYTPLDVLTEAVKHDVHIWVLRADDCSGVWVTRIEQHPGGKELFTWLMAGSGGLHRHTKFIMERLQRFAEKTDCRWMTGLAIPRLARYYKAKQGFDTPYVFVLKEV